MRVGRGSAELADFRRHFVFVYEPFPFDREYARAMVKPLSADRELRFVTIPTLIEMKLLADRAQDRIDIENLRMRLVE